MYRVLCFIHLIPGTFSISFTSSIRYYVNLRNRLPARKVCHMCKKKIMEHKTEGIAQQVVHHSGRMGVMVVLNLESIWLRLE